MIDGLGFKKLAGQSFPAELFWSAIDADERLRLADQSFPVELFWSTIDAEGERLEKHLLIFIDAINEYNPGGEVETGPVGLMRELDQMISSLNDEIQPGEVCRHFPAGNLACGPPV